MKKDTKDGLTVLAAIILLFSLLWFGGAFFNDTYSYKERRADQKEIKKLEARKDSLRQVVDKATELYNSRIKEAASW